MLLFSFLEGIGFDPFFRGLLSVLVGVVVLIGGTYLLLATNTGVRTGFLLAGTALFGWMFLMGTFWTIYGIGWRGDPPSWSLVEISRDEAGESGDGMAAAEHDKIIELGRAFEKFDVTEGATSEDPDRRQAEVYEYGKENSEKLAGWRYLVSSDPIRGEAQSSADVFLHSEHVFESAADYVPLAFGGYTTGGKPPLKDDPRFYDRVFHKIASMTIHPIHSEELMAIQVQEIVHAPTLPGEAPPVAMANPDEPVYTVIMKRERGGPLPWLFGGLRFVPAMFAMFNGIVFALFVWIAHSRDKREMLVRA